MNLPLLVWRILHIVFGAFWVGALLFNAIFLFPAMQEAGPEAAKVGAGLMRRRFLDLMPAAAVITVLSGLWLYWKDSAGFQNDFMRSGPGMAFGVGAVAAIAALILGVAVMRPSMLKAARLSQQAAGLPAAERDSHLASALALRLRAGAAGRIVAVLLTVAIGAMAVARYL